MVTVRFDVVPAPGAAAVLGLGGLLAARRRRTRIVVTTTWTIVPAARSRAAGTF